MTGTNEKRAPLTTDTEIRDFLMGGNATITMLNTKTGTRHTYRVRCKRDTVENGRGHLGPYRVEVMTGSDNTQHYTYMGYIPSHAHTGRYYDIRLGKKGSKIGGRDPRRLGFEWLWKLLHGLNMDESKRKPAENYVGEYSHVEVWHEGRCGCCGRKLTVPLSIERGIGPDCWEWYKGQ